MTRVPRAAVYAAFLLSGVTALIYQIIWSRYLTLLVGGTSVAHTIVLATFMGGLAFGNAYFGRRADRPGTDRLRLYALLEVGIGLLCLLFPAVFDAVSRSYLALASLSGPGSASNHVLKVLLAAASMFVPCALMGGTLPTLAKYVVDSMAGLGVRIGWLYFINTAGAVVGCILGGFYVVEAIGLEAGMTVGALVNLAIGAVFYFWAKRAAAAPAAPAAAEAEPPGGPAEAVVYSARQARVAFWCIAVAGAVSMLYELAWTRVLTLSIGGTVHSFSTMLISFISGIALGSWIAARLMRRSVNALALFGLCEVGIAVSILLPLHYYERLPFAFHRIGQSLQHSSETYGIYLLGQVLLSATIMLVPTTLIGAALPFAGRVCVDSLDVLGRRLGGVFSANTVGTVVGAVVAGFVLLPWIGVQRTFLFGSLVSGLLGMTLLWAWRLEPRAGAVRVAGRGASLWPAPAALAVAVGAAVLAPSWEPRLMQQGLYRWGAQTFADWSVFREQALRGRLLYVRDGTDATVAVEQHTPVHVSLRVNGKPDASTGSDMITQLLVGHLPMLLHRQPERAMVVGLGSGVTAAAVLAHPGVRADVAEISPEVVQAARFFEPWNAGVLRNPRMDLHLLDAREFMLLTRDRYDVIVSEPTNVWIPGVANLFTRDFYQVVRSRLKAGGLFAQWMHGYLAHPDMVASVVTTLRVEFPYVTAWLVGETDVIFLAADTRPSFDPPAFARRLEALRPTFDLQVGQPRRLEVFRDPVMFLGLQIGTGEGVDLAWPRGTGTVYRDLRPRLEFQAARAQFVAGENVISRQLDERLTRLGTEPLFLEQFLAWRPLDEQARLQLIDRLEGLERDFAQLRSSLATWLILQGHDDLALLFAVPEPLVARVTFVRRLAEQIDNGGPSAQRFCQPYLVAHRALLREARSVFGRPQVDAFAARMQRCLAARNDVGLKARYAQALADAGAAPLALAVMAELERDGALSTLERKPAADLLVSGAVLLLESGSYEQALAWAKRAADIDPGSTAATRIIAALTARGVSAAPMRTAIRG